MLLPANDRVAGVTDPSLRPVFPGDEGPRVTFATAPPGPSGDAIRDRVAA